jgi:hypothetical protein
MFPQIDFAKGPSAFAMGGTVTPRHWIAEKTQLAQSTTPVSLGASENARRPFSTPFQTSERATAPDYTNVQCGADGDGYREIARRNPFTLRSDGSTVDARRSLASSFRVAFSLWLGDCPIDWQAELWPSL